MVNVIVCGIVRGMVIGVVLSMIGCRGLVILMAKWSMEWNSGQLDNSGEWGNSGQFGNSEVVKK